MMSGGHVISNTKRKANSLAYPNYNNVGKVHSVFLPTSLNPQSIDGMALANDGDKLAEHISIAIIVWYVSMSVLRLFVTVMTYKGYAILHLSRHALVQSCC